MWMMIAPAPVYRGACRRSAVGAAPFASVMTPKERLNVSNSAALLPQPDSHMMGRRTNSSNKISATESTNQLTRTALMPCREYKRLRTDYEAALRRWGDVYFRPWTLKTLIAVETLSLFPYSILDRGLADCSVRLRVRLSGIRQRTYAHRRR
jgi:hypothetical protein